MVSITIDRYSFIRTNFKKIRSNWTNCPNALCTKPFLWLSYITLLKYQMTCISHLFSKRSTQFKKPLYNIVSVRNSEPFIRRYFLLKNSLSWLFSKIFCLLHICLKIIDNVRMKNKNIDFLYRVSSFETAKLQVIFSTKNFIKYMVEIFTVILQFNISGFYGKLQFSSWNLYYTSYACSFIELLSYLEMVLNSQQEKNFSESKIFYCKFEEVMNITIRNWRKSVIFFQYVFLEKLFIMHMFFSAKIPVYVYFGMTYQILWYLNLLHLETAGVWNKSMKKSVNKWTKSKFFGNN